MSPKVEEHLFLRMSKPLGSIEIHAVQYSARNQLKRK
jgi:hypothetical protein